MEAEIIREMLSGGENKRNSKEVLLLSKSLQKIQIHQSILKYLCFEAGKKTFMIFGESLDFANFLFNFLHGINFREKGEKSRKFLSLKYELYFTLPRLSENDVQNIEELTLKIRI